MDKEILGQVKNLIIASASKKQDMNDLQSSPCYTFADSEKVYKLKKQCISDIKTIFDIVNGRQLSKVVVVKEKDFLRNFLAAAEHVQYRVRAEDLDGVFTVLSRIKDNIDIELLRQTHHVKSKLLDMFHTHLSQEKPLINQTVETPVVPDPIVEAPVVEKKLSDADLLYQKNLFVLNHYLAPLKKLLGIHNKLIDEKDVADLSDPMRYEHITALGHITPIIEEIGRLLSFKAGDFYQMVDPQKKAPYVWCELFLQGLRRDVFQAKLTKRIIASRATTKSQKKEAETKKESIVSTYTDIQEINDIKIVVEEKPQKIEEQVTGISPTIVEEKKDAPKEKTRIDISNIDPTTGRIRDDFF